MRPSRQGGFTLLEVIMATAVLAGSVVVLLQIIYVGKGHIRNAEDYATAQLICQTRLNEILAGAKPLEAVEKEYLYEMPGWVLVVEVNPLAKSGLAELRVIVKQDASGGSFPVGGQVPVGGDLFLDESAPLEGQVAFEGQVSVGGQIPVGAQSSVDEDSAKQFMLVRWAPDPLGVAGGTSPDASFDSDSPFDTSSPFGTSSPFDSGESGGLFTPSGPSGFSDPFDSGAPFDSNDSPFPDFP